MALLLSASTIACTSVFAQNPYDPNSGMERDIKQMTATVEALPAQLSAAITQGFSSLDTFIGPNSKPPAGQSSSLKYFLTQHWISVDPSTIPNSDELTALNTTQTSVVPSQFTLPSASAIFSAQTSVFDEIMPGGNNAQNANKPEQATPMSPASAADAVAQNETSNNLYNSLSQFMYEMYNPNKVGPSNADKAKQDISFLKPAGHTDLSPTDTKQNPTFEDYMNQNAIKPLTIDTKASDTLFVPNSSDESIKQPSALNNAYLNFANIITPMVYTPEQSVAANQYLKFAAESTRNLAQNINFFQLYGNNTALKNLQRNPDYRNFVYKIRSLLAIRSVSINTIDQLIAERTPMRGLGKAIGLPAQNDTNSPPRVSPLQVEHYKATHDIENPNWYKTVANYPATTLQREILISLKEIQQQNYQAHIDRERILAALTAQNMQSNTQQMDMTLQSETQKVNNAIDSALGEKTQTTPSGKGAVEKATEIPGTSGTSTSSKTGQ